MPDTVLGFWTYTNKVGQVLDLMGLTVSKVIERHEPAQWLKVRSQKSDCRVPTLAPLLTHCVATLCLSFLTYEKWMPLS